MPKLRRMRLVSIGHESARFPDVTLDFTDRTDRPTNSVVWLRNGGGKTSLLSLFFAGVQPNRREFLGQRAEEKIRSIDDYVAAQDHAIVACEWELDSETSLFEDHAPRYLTGVFYQRSSSHEGNGKPGVDRLFFASMVSTTIPELSLDGLPVFGQSGADRHRRTLTAFRRRLKQLDDSNPQQNIFHTDKQHQFEEELASHGIDPEVFRYQVRMNEREGGVLERFSFAEDEEFVDLVLEMAFSQRRAKEVRDQLSTFRQELMERNDQLKPELEYCQGLLTKLESLAGVQRERAIVFQETHATQQKLVGLKNWIDNRLQSIAQEKGRIQKQIRAAEIEAENARSLADRASRAAAVYHRHACELRFNLIDREYQAAGKAHAEAKRLKNIWSAARPLARSLEARRQAKLLREQLARKQQEYAPDLERLKEVATEFANALDYRAANVRKDELGHQQAATELTGAANEFFNEAQSAGEFAVAAESQAKELTEKLRTAESELQLLRRDAALQKVESADEGKHRLSAAIQDTKSEITTSENAITQQRSQKQQLAGQLQSAQTAVNSSEIRLHGLNQELERAESLRSELEADAALLRLLQVNEINVESAAARAVETASEELRRVNDTILRIRIEAAEDKRAIDWLKGDGELLPPSRDVEAVLTWFATSGITAWSGWEYIARNKLPEERRALAERLPFIATGIVVANRDYDRVIELTEHQTTAPRLQTALTVVPADAIEDTHPITWTVIGPTSDGYFDKDAAARELNRLTNNQQQCDDEITTYQEWYELLAPLREKLRAFQLSYPLGWFARLQQKIEVATAHFEEAKKESKRIEDRLAETERELEGSLESRDECQSRLSTMERQLVLVDAFIRQYGTHLPKWERQLASAQRNVQKHRASQKRLQEQATKALNDAKDHEKRAHSCAMEAYQLENDISRLKYVDDANRQQSPGAIEPLRSDYQLLLAEYEAKVESETLEQIAKRQDHEADKEQRDFQRVLGRFADISASDVEEELSCLPVGSSVEERAEQADSHESSALQRHGSLANQWRPAEEKYQDALEKCAELLKSGCLPELATFESESLNHEQAVRLNKEADEQSQFAEGFDAEAIRFKNNLALTERESETLERDNQRISSIETNHQDQFERLLRYQPGIISVIGGDTVRGKDIADLARQIDAVESAFHDYKRRQRQLDEQRDALAEDVGQWSRQKRFSNLPLSISQRFADKRGEQLESKASFFITQLEDRVLEIDRKLEEANQHHDRVVNIVTSAVEEGLSLLKRVSRMSRLPDTLPQAGKHFLVIDTKAPDNPVERRAKVSDLIEEILHSGNVEDGVKLIQKAVRRVAVRTKVRVLHPDLHRSAQRMSISAMRGKSGGERLTCAILLFCTLVRLRQHDGTKKGSSVLILDNPIGTASRVSFLDLQREVAESMNVQLIYATGVKDLNAVGALENVIRLRNSRIDRRTGRRIIEVEGDGEWAGEIDAARVVFNSPPGSVVGINRGQSVADSELAEHVDHP